MAAILALRPGLWLVESAVEDFDVRGVVVAGREGAVVWDTLARPPDMAGVAELAAGLPLTVVYSHGDWDHVWGTAGLARAPREILAHAACLPRFREEVPATLKEKRGAYPGVYDDVVLVPPTRPAEAGERLGLGGVTLELHPLPGHTPDSLVGWIPEWRVLLAGDAVETPLPVLNPGGPVEAWAGELTAWAERLAPEPSSLVIPSHGPIGGPELLRRNAAYLRALLEGGAWELPAGTPPFYLRTHADNVRRAGEADGDAC